ncbi:MAG TPA: histone deacetylase [Phycisphaerae bacterium]|nr:histone deacetylase [Phycisphaerae bacterium]
MSGSCNPRCRTGLVFDEVYLDHYTGLGHPESPRRLQAVIEGLAGAGLLDTLTPIEPVEPRVEWVEAVHTRPYIEAVQRECAAGRMILSTGDTNICAASYEVALTATAGAVAAVQAVLDGKVTSAFCAVRPPGHHAWAGGGMGFCIFNNAAIAVRYAQQHCGVERVLIVDWDLHHGNGTQDIFYEDGSVLYCSTHRTGLYPMALTGRGHASETGAGAGRGTNLNIPLPPGSGDEDVIAAVRERLMPAAERFAAQLLVISAGFDSRRGDPLGDMSITDDGYAQLTKLATGLVEGGRAVSVLEGGYSPRGLASAVAAHVEALMDVSQPGEASA